MSCIFCDIVAGKIPCRKIGENELALAFLDVSPASDGHTVIIPKKHFQNLADTPKEYLDAVVELAQQVAKNIEISELKP
jgi:histidine triad (HIT) family protein